MARGITQKRKAYLESIPAIHDFGNILRDKVYEGILSLSESSIYQYMSEVEIFLKLMDLPYGATPTKEQCMYWRNHKWVGNGKAPYSKKSMAKKIPAINRYLEYFCGITDWKIPMVKNIKREHRPTRLTEQQINDMVEYNIKQGFHTRAIAIFIGFKCASRKTSLLDLKIEDIDFANGYIYLRHTKGDNDQEVPMSNEDMAIIKEYIDNHRPEPELEEDKPYLFITETINHQKGVKNHRRISEGYLRFALLHSAQECGIKVRVYPHCLRHSRIWDLRGKGFSWEEVMAITGHKSILSLSDYIQEEKKESVREKLNRDHNQIRPQPTQPEPALQRLTIIPEHTYHYSNTEPRSEGSGSLSWGFEVIL